MKAGKSIGKKSAVTSGKKATRKKGAPVSSKGATKKSKLPASAKKASPVTPAQSPGKKASGAPPVSARKTSAKKKNKPAVAEKARGGITGGDLKVKKVRAKATPQRPAEAAEKKTTRRTAKTAIKGKKTAIARKTKGQVTAGPRRRAVRAGLPVVPAGEVLAATAQPVLPLKKTTAARRKIELAAARSRYELPREYGEDDITAIVVDPYEVFAHWEIREEHFTGSGKKLILRLQNSEPEGNGSHPWTEDILILQRVGSGFFPLGVHCGQTVLIMGTVGPGGRFRPIVSTGKLTIPAFMTPQEDETPAEMSSGRIGY